MADGRLLGAGRQGLVRAIKDGVSATSIKKELLALEARQAELQQKLEAPEMPELLHPRMADAYREKVAKLCQALEHEDSRLGATKAIRELIDSILLEPDGEQLKITLKGDLAGMLGAARDSKRSPDTGNLLVQIQMGFAGAGFAAASCGPQARKRAAHKTAPATKTNEVRIGCGGGI